MEDLSSWNGYGYVNRNLKIPSDAAYVYVRAALGPPR